MTSDRPRGGVTSASPGKATQGWSEGNSRPLATLMTGSSAQRPVNASADTAERLRIAAAFLEHSKRNSRFDECVLRDLREPSFEAGRVTCVVPVTEKLENRYGTLHGGCIATLVDVVSTAALITLSDSSGVTLDLNVSYMTAAKHGDSVVVDAKVLKTGKSTAALEVELRSVATGSLVAKGRHNKFLLGMGGGSVTAFLDKQRAKL